MVSKERVEVATGRSFTATSRPTASHVEQLIRDETGLAEGRVIQRGYIVAQMDSKLGGYFDLMVEAGVALRVELAADTPKNPDQWRLTYQKLIDDLPRLSFPDAGQSALAPTAPTRLSAGDWLTQPYVRTFTQSEIEKRHEPTFFRGMSH